MAENLISLIRRAKPRSAVLTTFTFGLGYFEAAILPALRTSGCSDITVLLDEGEYLASLGSTFSSGAGRSYRLLPVRAPGGGIFHPKIAYLECSESDCLVVGSGNLTQAGQGGQLENIDAVMSNLEPGAFSGARDFFASLSRRLPYKSPSLAETLNRLVERIANQVGNSEVQAERTLLIHTVDRSAADQLREVALAWSTDYERLTVMSPFHARDALPVLELAKSLGVARIEFVVDPRAHSIALDGNVFQMPPGSRFVAPLLEGTMLRQSHAKWWELECENGLLVMTGSVNATAASFARVDNIEVALIRKLEPGTVLAQWSEEAKPILRYEPMHRNPVGKNDCALHALLNEQGALRGSIQALGPFPETGALTVLSDGQEVQQTIDVSILDDGTFSCLLDSSLTGAPSPLQALLMAPQFRARGWILNTFQLELTESQRQVSVALARIIRGIHTPDDEQRMLQRFIELLNTDQLAASVDSGAQTRQESGNTVGQGGGNTKSVPGTGADPPAVYTAPRSAAAERALATLERHAAQTIDAVYAWLHGRRRRSLRHSKQNADGKDTNLPPLLSDEQKQQSDRQPAAGQKGCEEQLAHAVEDLPKVLAAKPNHARAVELILIAAGVSLKDTYELNGWLTARRCIRWLETYGSFQYPDEVRRELVPAFLVMACLAVAMTRGEPDGQVAIGQAKDMLQRFGVDLTDPEANDADCRRGLRLRAFAGLDEAVRASLPDELPAICANDTTTDLIVRLVPLIRAGECPEPSESQRQLLGSDFFAAVKRFRSDRKRLGEMRDIENKGCAACGLVMFPEVRQRLRRTRAAVCLDLCCGRPLVWIADLSRSKTNP